MWPPPFLRAGRNTEIYAYLREQEKAAGRDKGERLRSGYKRNVVEIYIVI